MRASYPSDITREQFEVIRYILESAKKATHPREIDTYEIYCAVLYRLREGCRWRSLPHDFPKWQICYYHYNIWRSAKDGEESVMVSVLSIIPLIKKLSEVVISFAPLFLTVTLA